MNIGEVYFAQAESGPIKIGFSTNPSRRIANIQTTLPERLVLIAAVRGTMRTELFFHHRLAAHNITGEWFQPHDDVLQAIWLVQTRGEESVPAECRATGEDAAPAEIVMLDDFVEVCRDYCIAIAGPRVGDEKIHDLITRCAEITGLRRPTIRRIWYREHGAIHAFQYVRLKEIFEAREAIKAARALGAVGGAVAQDEGE